MKNSEEDILKRFLQDTFSDYEPEPSDLTWENIRKEIQPQQPFTGAGLKHWFVPVVALFLWAWVCSPWPRWALVA